MLSWCATRGPAVLLLFALFAPGPQVRAQGSAGKTTAGKPPAGEPRLTAADQKLRVELEAAYAELVTRMRALTQKKDLSQQELLEAFRAAGAPRVPADLSTEDFARAKQAPPVMVALFEPVSAPSKIVAGAFVGTPKHNELRRRGFHVERRGLWKPIKRL